MQSIAATIAAAALFVVAGFLKFGELVGILDRHQQRVAHEVERWAVITAVLLAPAALIGLYIQHAQGPITEIVTHMFDGMGETTTTTTP